MESSKDTLKGLLNMFFQISREKKDTNLQEQKSLVRQFFEVGNTEDRNKLIEGLSSKDTQELYDSCPVYLCTQRKLLFENLENKIKKQTELIRECDQNLKDNIINTSRDFLKFLKDNKIENPENLKKLQNTEKDTHKALRILNIIRTDLEKDKQKLRGELGEYESYLDYHINRLERKKSDEEKAIAEVLLRNPQEIQAREMEIRKLREQAQKLLQEQKRIEEEERYRKRNQSLYEIIKIDKQIETEETLLQKKEEIQKIEKQIEEEERAQQRAQEPREQEERAQQRAQEPREQPREQEEQPQQPQQPPGAGGCKEFFSNHWGKIAIAAGVVTIFAAYYAIAALPPKESHSWRVMPFQNISKTDIKYDTSADTWLKYLTATVSLQLRDLCKSQREGYIPWIMLRGILLQHPALQPRETAYGEKTYAGEFTEPKVKDWLDKFVTECDKEVSDAARLHDPEITEVIRFVANQSTWFSIIPKSVSNSTSLLDIGMIRFPTKDNPYVKLYRLQLTGAFSGSSHIMPSGGDETRVLTATVDSCSYYPNVDILQRINPEYVDKTIARFEDTLTA